MYAYCIYESTLLISSEYNDYYELVGILVVLRIKIVYMQYAY
jgi:hypothetical protein